MDLTRRANPPELPAALAPGDKVAVVSLSWGGPAAAPARFAAGRQVLEQTFGLEVVVMPHALKPDDWLYRHPEARAADLMQAFRDPAIKGIVSSIGGDDSLRILKYLDPAVIRDNPKIFLGYSDTTATHLYCFKLGLTSFYGPSLMAGFAEAGGMFDYTRDAVQRMLFNPQTVGAIPPHNGPWTHTPPDFANDDYRIPRPRNLPVTRLALQGAGSVEGHLLGGCFEVLEFCRGTPAWPTPAQWQGALLFIETAQGESASPPHRLTWFFRSLGAAGILSGLAGVILGRPGEQVPVEHFPEFEAAVLKVFAEERLTSVPVISRFEFGHTDPMCLLPYGTRARLSVDDCSLTLLEPCTR